jgi:hypothetical protein
MKGAGGQNPSIFKSVGVEQSHNKETSPHGLQQAKETVAIPERNLRRVNSHEHKNLQSHQNTNHQESSLHPPKLNKSRRSSISDNKKMSAAERNLP